MTNDFTLINGDCFEELLVKTIHEDGNVNSVESNLNLNNTEYEFKMILEKVENEGGKCE